MAIIGLFKIRINPDFDIFMLEDSEYRHTLNKMDKIFSSSEQTLFLVEANNEELSPDIIHEFRKVQSFLEGIDNNQSMAINYCGSKINLIILNMSVKH